MEYIRPKIKTRPAAPTQFVSRVGPSGAIRSQWAPVASVPRIASGTPGVVGRIVDLMNKGLDSVEFPEKSEWRPPLDYEWYAKKMGLGPEFIKRCEDWHAKHPPPVPVVKVIPEIDPEPILKMMKKYSKKGAPSSSGHPMPARPPLDRMKVAWECAGYSEAAITKAVARWNYEESQMDVRQKAIDDIFGKFGTPKRVAVKKKMVS